MTRARDGLRQLLTTPILFTPIVESDRRGLRFEGTGALGAILSGGLVTKMASPDGSGEFCAASCWIPITVR